MIDRDPPRLFESASDARVRQALTAARARTPSAPQLEALAAKVGGAAYVSSGGAGFFAKLLGQASGLKVSVALVALGSALWLARNQEPERAEQPAAPAPAMLEAPPVEPAPVEPARVVLQRVEQRVPAARVEHANEPSAAPASLAQPPRAAPAERPASSKRAARTASVRAAEPPARSRSIASGASALEPRETLVAEPSAEPKETPAAGLSELELLGRVQGMLARDPDGALDLLEEHRAAFPRGAFSEEREALAIDALRRLGKTRELQARARAFLGAYPSSPHRDRISAWLE